MSKNLFWLIVVAVGSFSGGMAGLVLVPRCEKTATAQAPPYQRETNATPTPVTDLLSISERFELVARKVSPAVVYVEARRPGDKNSADSKKVIEESGSGVLVRWQGRQEYFVLTNNHVVDQAEPSQVLVTLADSRVLRPVRVWRDPESDLALLALDLLEGLPVAVLGDSDQMRVGQWVLAIGSPFGLNQTVTHGIISARERGQISLGNSIRIKEFLQTDAAINPGSSGGPLINLNGEIIGINTAIASPSGSNSGVSFSIPSNLVKRVVQQLLERGAVTRGYLGVQLSDTFEPAQALKLGLDRVQGAYVDVVYPGTPAATAGLRTGDVILEIDGVALRNENQLINYISLLPAGKQVPLVVWRDRRRMTLNAVVGDWAKAQERLQSYKVP